MSTSKAQPKSLNAWLKELDSVCLPVSRDSHSRAVSALRNSNSSLREIAEQLQQSPALALAIMRGANSSKNSLGEPAANLEVALTRLGLQNAETLLNKLIPVAESDIPRPLRQLQQISRHTSHQASGLFGARLARLWHDIQCSSLLFLAPLWPLVARYPELFTAWEQRVLVGGEPASKVEQQLLGVPLLQLCLGLAEKWCLPEWILHSYRLLLNDRRQLVKCLRIAGNGEQSSQQQQRLDDDASLRRWLTLPANCIVLANGLAIAAHQSWDCKSSQRWQQLTALYLQLNLSDLQALTHQHAAQSARTHHESALWHPAEALLWPWRASHLKAEQPVLAKTEIDTWRKHCGELLREPSAFANVLQLTNCARDALQACGIQRLLILLSDRTHSRLLSQQSLGLNVPASGLSLDPSQSQVLRRLLAEAGQLRLTPGNIAQYSALLPGNLKSLFPGEHLILRSIANQQRVAMLRVADQGGGPLNEVSVQAFGKTVQCIERALASFASRAR